MSNYVIPESTTTIEWPKSKPKRIEYYKRNVIYDSNSDIEKERKNGQKRSLLIGIDRKLIDPSLFVPYWMGCQQGTDGTRYKQKTNGIRIRITNLAC